MNVYFIKTLAKPPMVKIGRAIDPQGRMAELQTGCPYVLILLGVIKCKSIEHSIEIERSAHEIFKKFRHRGEWFKYKRLVEDTIGAVLSGKRENLRHALRVCGSQYQKRHDNQTEAVALANQARGF